MFQIMINNFYDEPKAYTINSLEDMVNLYQKYHIDKEFFGNLKNPRSIADKFVKRISRGHITANIIDPQDSEDIYDPNYNVNKIDKISTIMDVKNLLENEEPLEEIEIPEKEVLMHEINRRQE